METKREMIRKQLRLLCGQDGWATAALRGVRSLRVADGPCGLRIAAQKGHALPAMPFPSAQLLGNTWSRECAAELGRMLADEAAEAGIDILLAPGVNIKRHPLNGRNFEYYAEDPCLAGELARSFIAALQAGGVGACLKHFAAYNYEYDRTHQSSEVDERTLREIYYRAFEIACEAKPVSVMCSYNRVNGVYSAENAAGFRILREEFGFDGTIFSDWGAVRDRTASAKAGLDIEMPFQPAHYERLVADYDAGKLSDAEAQACEERVLEMVARCDRMRVEPHERSGEAERAAAAAHIAGEGMVLLKNDGILPLRGTERIAVSGCYARPKDLSLLAGGGSSRVEWGERTFDLPAALASLTGVQVTFDYAFAGGKIGCHDPRSAALHAAESDVAVVCVGTGAELESEESNRESLRLPEGQEILIRALAEHTPTVVVVFAGGAVDMSGWIGDVSAVLYAGFCGFGGDRVIAELLLGRRDPCGRLSETFPLRLSDVPAVHFAPELGVTRYAEGLDVGYRYFDRSAKETLFPFGFGLSYARFAYRGLHLEYTEGGIAAVYEIENLSDRAGTEVSQVYVGEDHPLVYRPRKELKGFSKDGIAPGGCKTVRVPLTLRDFMHWSVAHRRWVADDGTYTVYVCRNAACEELKARVRIQNGTFLPE